ncbi:unnamed protein product [Aphanomyces euteiches]|uniref:Major facilitator superfamily associated domain-containing protein n=1 Tax=Aphanomyces euteiches TaxID=100861 RepID=A0A6G0WKS0_9STRA|nr:hypothetical protein Ae201684_014194 [Aphanomyces euteiches]KAH9069288.1 hypothetical protein Ae201684P_004974 [Aphanomyces euteiches]KAH9154246.1 hypothetical protein AeRB84_003626 [Aphanomyces euteiches]
MALQPQNKGLELQERLSYLSADRDNKNADGEYVDGKTPNDLEDGALREGGAPVYTSPEVLGLLGQYFVVGLLYGALPYVPYNILINYYNLEGTQYNAAKALISLGWSLKAFVGLISDVFPIMGYRRKGYMLGGWFLCGVTLLVLSVLDHGEPFNFDLDVEDPINKDIQSRGSTLGLLCALATICYIFADVPADAMVVEYAQREPEQIRGRMQTMIYSVRTITSMATTLIMGLCLNSKRFQSDFSWDMGLNGFFIMLTVPAFLAVPMTYFFIKDPKREAIPFMVYARQFWALVQKRCVWQIMCFNFFFNLCAYYVPSVAAGPVQAYWAKVGNLNNNIMSAVGSLFFAIILAVMGKWGTMWNWRYWLVITILVMNSLDAICQFFTIYDVYRNQWFYLGVPLVEQVPYAVQFIITTFAIVEIADVGNEGLIYGLLTTCSNMASPFGSMISNIIGDHFQVKSKQIKEDSDYTRNQVAYTYIIYYCFVGVAMCLVIFYPNQKKMIQEWKKNDKDYKLVGGTVLLGAFCILVVSITANILTMFESTKCLRLAGGHGC